MCNCVYIYSGKRRCSLMYSLEFMKFLVGRDADDFINNEKKSEPKLEENIMFRYAKFATIPIEIKK